VDDELQAENVTVMQRPRCRGTVERSFFMGAHSNHQISARTTGIATRSIHWIDFDLS
jgi:hypothetical protein